MDRRAWQATVHGVTKSWSRRNDLASTQAVLQSAGVVNPPEVMPCLLEQTPCLSA